VRSSAATVEDYLAEMPADRRAALSKVRQVILDNLPDGYVEAMNWGMIAYEVPLSIEPKTYNSQPLMVAALSNQKKHMAVYLCGLYCGVPLLKDDFEAAYRKAGLRLDMGAACVRFRRIEDLHLDAVAAAIRAVPVETFVERARR
jgi:hypothetical protein